MKRNSEEVDLDMEYDVSGTCGGGRVINSRGITVDGDEDLDRS